MQLNEATYRAHDQYLNHVLRCTSCYPPTKRYCYDGSGLHDRYLAHFLMSEDLHTRRTYLARLEPVDPTRCEALKTLLLEIHESEKNAA
ncbi:hypothetical protein GZ982_30110 (plasmid) [Pseudomonas fluorescens]|nr:hypothetical protein GZ982_30110 [Pseudomonas fluorescens]